MFTLKLWLQDSPLHRSLPDGIVIVALDDLQLTSPDSSMDLWTSYLSDTQISDTPGNIGWCVDAEWFLGKYRPPSIAFY